MIDEDGFRPNVGIIVVGERKGVFWAKRIGQQSWQFPQGGIQEGETPEEALYRELYEEAGLEESAVQLQAVTRGWLRYRLPKRLVRKDEKRPCIGQKQKWFLLKLAGDEGSITFDASGSPEFDRWRWVSYWYPLGQIISFKREVYRRALIELAPAYNQLSAKRR